jgi:hypothetical protein
MRRRYEERAKRVKHDRRSPRVCLQRLESGNRTDAVGADGAVRQGPSALWKSGSGFIM